MLRETVCVATIKLDQVLQTLRNCFIPASGPALSIVIRVKDRRDSLNCVMLLPFAFGNIELFGLSFGLLKN
jgi:hypothetical protein